MSRRPWGGEEMPDEIYYQSFLNHDRVVHIVDADLQTCETLSVLFRLEGFQTLFSINLAGFLASLERRHPDIIVANVELGADDGVELLHRVNAMRVGAPVFMLEDTPMVEVAVRAMRAGAADVMTKPIDSALLIGNIRDALRQDVRVAVGEVRNRAVEVRGFARLTPREREVLQLITN